MVVHTHDLRSVGQRVRFLPSVPGAATLDGLKEHVLLCIGHYDDALESHIVSFADLTVVTGAPQRTGGGPPACTSELNILGAWECPGAVTDIHVSDLGGGDVLLAASTSKGSVWCARMLLPRAPGSTPEDISLTQLQTEEGNPQRLAPQYISLHRGAISSAHVQAETRTLLTAGDDGGICLVDLEVAVGAGEGEENGAVRRLGRGAGRGGKVGCSAYSNARWADTSTFATVDLTGRLQLWDVRDSTTASKPTSTAPWSWGHGAPRAGKPLPAAGSRCCWWLDVHASRPDLAATSGSLGEVALWDLRLMARPVVATAPGGDMGDVWEVRFDPLQQQSVAPTAAPTTSSSNLGLLFGTSEGTIGLATPSPPSASTTQLGTGPVDGAWRAWGGDKGAGGQGAARALHRSPLEASVNSVDVGGPAGADVVAVTDANELIFMRRTL